MLKRIYIEIGNVCNLSCSFCPTLKRAPKIMTAQEFEGICENIEGKCENIFLHIMGEPLLHPQFDEILKTAAAYGFNINITTNGTLIKEKADILLKYSTSIHKISYSLHSYEANKIGISIDEYLDNIIEFAKLSADSGIYNVFRLWNLDTFDKSGTNFQNPYIEGKLKSAFNEAWQGRWSGFRLSKNVFLEYDGIFVWPTESKSEDTDKGHCHGLLDQIGILADGTVVPCCLDSEGEINLGNIFENSLEDILSNDRASHMRENLQKGILTEHLCKKCSYAKRFSK